MLSSQGAGRRLDGGLLSVAEVAASIFQSEKWEGTGSCTTTETAAATASGVCVLVRVVSRKWSTYCMLNGHCSGVVLSGTPVDGLTGFKSGPSVPPSMPSPENPPEPADIMPCSSFLVSSRRRGPCASISPSSDSKKPPRRCHALLIPAGGSRDLWWRSVGRPIYNHKFQSSLSTQHNDRRASFRSGTAEQHEDLIRRVSVGRSGEQAAMLALAKELFEGNCLGAVSWQQRKRLQVRVCRSETTKNRRRKTKEWRGTSDELILRQKHGP